MHAAVRFTTLDVTNVPESRRHTAEETNRTLAEPMIANRQARERSQILTGTIANRMPLGGRE